LQTLALPLGYRASVQNHQSSFTSASTNKKPTIIARGRQKIRAVLQEFVSPHPLAQAYDNPDSDNSPRKFVPGLFASSTLSKTTVRRLTSQRPLPPARSYCFVSSGCLLFS
jgi:hypothetical protein